MLHLSAAVSSAALCGSISIARFVRLRQFIYKIDMDAIQPLGNSASTCLRHQTGHLLADEKPASCSLRRLLLSSGRISD